MSTSFDLIAAPQRVVGALNNRGRGEPVACIANAPKMSRGADLSVCARCRGADILLSEYDIYRIYEPGVNLTYGYDSAPNACNECHSAETAAWDLEWVNSWYGP